MRITILLFLAAAHPVWAWNEGGGDQDEAMTLTPDVKNGRAVYEICTACHLPEGWGTREGSFPQIAGQLYTVTIKQLADIRAGNRDNPTMYPYSLPKEIGGAQAIADVAAYIAQLPMTPNNGVGPGDDLKHGAKLYRDNCTACHGEHGEGDNAKVFPLLQGQHYHYMLRQFKWIRDGKRRNANPEMAAQIAGFNERDMEAVIDYTSRLRPPAERMAPPGWINPDFD